MARTENLEEFLTDVADAIKTKKGTTDKIPAANFDTEIASIETGIDTSDATATAGDIINPKTAYVNGEKITGSIIPEYIATSRPNVSTNTINNGNNLTIIASSYKYGIVVTSNDNNARIYKILQDGNIGTEYTTILLSDITGDASTTRALNYAGIAHKTIRDDVVNVYLLANSKGSWITDIPIGICEVNIKTLKIEKISTVKATSMGPYQWYGGNIYPRPNSADCFILGFSGQSNGTCQQYVAVGRNSETNEYSVRYSSWGDTWNRSDRQRMLTLWSDDGTYCYCSNNKWNRLFSVSDDGYTWSKVVENNLSKPIPLNKHLAILNNDVYNLDTNTIIAQTPNSLTINASTENYCISNGYLFVYISNTLQIYSVNASEIAYLGELSNVSSLKRLDGQYQQLSLLSSTNIISLIDTINIDKLLTSLSVANSILYNTFDADIKVGDVIQNKTAYGLNGKITGTMPNNGELNYTPSEDEQTIPAGYTSGGKIYATNYDDTLSPTEYTETLEKTSTILNGTSVDDILQQLDITVTDTWNEGSKVSSVSTKKDKYYVLTLTSDETDLSNINITGAKVVNDVSWNNYWATNSKNIYIKTLLIKTNDTNISFSENIYPILQELKIGGGK